MVTLSSLAQPGDRKLLGLKVQYAKCMWAARSILSRSSLYHRPSNTIGILPGDPRKRYLQSLLAIYDVKEMSRLDLAWWTFDAIEWADNFLQSREAPSVFEFGSGASTIWLARRAAKVTSVEDDHDFFKTVSEIKPSNVNYHLHQADTAFDAKYEASRHDLRGQSYKNYVTALTSNRELHDLIIIDGRCRQRCMEIAPLHLKPGGAILLDNSDMARFRGITPGIEMKTIVTQGLTPCLPYPTETTIFSSLG